MAVEIPGQPQESSFMDKDIQSPPDVRPSGSASLQDSNSNAMDDEGDQVSETKLRLKVDLMILPLLASIFFLSTLGSSNIGNALQAGLPEDLNIAPSMIPNITSIFLAGFVIGQLPGTLLLRVLGSQRQFAGAMFIWGLFTLGSAFSKSYGSILACRLFIGIAEAFVQGALVYLSFWYDYTELASRAAILGALTAISGAFGGLVAYATQAHLDGNNGWLAWRWLFLIEGVLPIGWSIVVLMLLPSTPNKVSRGFTQAEKHVLVNRAARSHNTGDNTVRLRLIPRVLLQPQWWIFAVIQSSLFLCGSTTTVFLPSIMAGLGYTGVRAQLMTVIPYAANACFVLAVCKLSDLTRVRGPWLLLCCLVTAVGYIVLLTTTNLPARLVATCLVLSGSNAPGVIAFAWVARTNVGYTYRSSAVAMINIVVYLVSLSGQYAFTDPPLYRKGLSVCLSLDGLAAVMTVLQMVNIKWLNSKKKTKQHMPELDELRAVSLDEIGNKHPDFFFGY